MKNKKRLFMWIAVFLTFLLMFSVTATIVDNATAKTSDNSKEVDSEQEIEINDNIRDELVRDDKKNGNPVSKYRANNWTFLVYLDADNNLESAGIDDFLEMATVGSDSNIHIVVQFDRTSGYDPSYGDWTTTKRYYITYDMDPTSANALFDLGERNMGSSATLSDFIIWGTTTYPADNYALVLWDHGAGWKNSNDENKDVTKAVCYDDTSFGDSITLVELEAALSNAGVNIELLGFDACLMAMAEVDYQIKDWVDVRVGSEEVEPGDGWPYDTILTDLKNTPSMSPTTLGQTIVTRYIQSYPGATIETQSSVDLTQESSLSSAIDVFGQALKNGIILYRTEISGARGASEEAFYASEFIDLYDFAYEINNRISNITIQNAAQDVMSAISSMLIAEEHGSSHPDFHGITIYYPQSSGSYDNDYETMLDFTADLSWDEFLNAYYGYLPDDNYEENDVRLSAYDISSYEQTWLSSIDGLGIQADNDWYEIYITPGDERLIVTLTFSDAAGDIDLAVYDSGGSPVTDSESITDNEYIDYVLSSSGTYYLLVYYEDAGNSYDLRWDDQDPGAGGDDAYEENDDLLSAYDISFAEQTWLSLIAGNGIQADYDWYEIYITPGYEHLVVTLTFSDVAGDIDLDVYDGSGFIVTYSDSTTDNEYINYVLPSSGTYYLLVYFDDAGNSYDLWWDDQFSSGAPDDNYEPNDYYWEAYDLSSYENVWLSSIDGSGMQSDDDWFEIYISSGELYLHVDLTFTHAEGDVDIDVCDINGYIITFGWSTTDNEYIDYILSSSGIYYLCVNWGDEGNSYDLKWYTSSVPDDDDDDDDDDDGNGGGGGGDKKKKKDEPFDIFDFLVSPVGMITIVLSSSGAIAAGVVSYIFIRKRKARLS